jgi:hypothetical protein
MNHTRNLLGILVLTLAQWSACDRDSSRAVADESQHPSTKLEGRYQGPWVTTKNKKLDGIANCEVEQLAKDKWKGRFWGVWQHVPFDYTVEFGPDKSNKRSDEPKNRSEKRGQLTADSSAIPVAGRATIDGARYDWTGTLAPNEFDIEFTGSRYEGHLELARVHQPVAVK